MVQLLVKFFASFCPQGTAAHAVACVKELLESLRLGTSHQCILFHAHMVFTEAPEVVGGSMALPGSLWSSSLETVHMSHAERQPWVTPYHSNHRLLVAERGGGGREEEGE